MRLFGKKDVDKDKKKLKKKLSKIRTGMSVYDLKNLAGEPNFSMKGSSAFGLAGHVFGAIPHDVMNKEHWVYKTTVGEFQVTVLDGRVINISGLDVMLKK